MAAEDEKDENSLTVRGGSDSSGEMSFWEHLEELRSTLLFCLFAFAAAGTLSLLFSKQIFEILRIPLEWANVPATEAQALVVMRFMDTFSILFYIALSGGIVLAGPPVIFRIVKFIAPALSDAERVRWLPLCAVSGLLFLAGAAIAFFWLAPVSIRLPYLLAEHLGVQMHWLAADYYLFVVMLTLFSGLMFEFPLVIVFLVYSGIVSGRALLEKWRWAATGILVCGLVISPIGDPVVLLVFSALLLAFYFIAVFVGEFLLKRKRGRERSDGF